MDGGATGSGGGGGPAPFLLKTYDMVDDSSTDDIVGWSFTRKSFVVWNPPEFARVLLPTYFKHNNFSSFIRQLNTYGFRKIDPEKWEFANEDFVKDKKHLLKNIHRRKPIHSHSNPQGTADSERSAYEEEIDKLSREKAALEANVLKFKHQQSTAKVQLQDFTQRISGLEQRQENLLSFLDKAVQNPDFVERLTQRLESMDVSVYNKKRRLPEVNQLIHHLSDQVNNMVDDHSSSKPDFGFPHDLCNKPRLELSPAVSDMNSPSHCTQSSNEDGENSPMRISDQLQKNLHQTGETLYTPETLELSDARTSFGQKMDSPLLCRADGVEALKSSTPNEEGTSHISCLLKLSLASFPPQISGSHSSTEMVHMADETGTISDTKSKSDGSEVDPIIPSKDKYVSDGNPTLSSSINKKQVPAISPPQANDVFWEQFLTERPGCSDNEEASSSFRANPYEELGGRKVDQGISRNMKSAQHLSL